MESIHSYICFLLFVPFVRGFSVSVFEREIKKAHNPAIGSIHDIERMLRNPNVKKGLDNVLKTALKTDVLMTDPHAKGCTCVGNNCGCCLHLKIDVIGLDSIVCVNVSYLPAPEYGISVTLSVGDRVIINETVSARNPPPICVDIPELKQLASICLKFSKLAITNKTFSGCLSLEARLAKIVKEDILIGCFKIPPNAATTRHLSAVYPRNQMHGKHLAGAQYTVMKERQFVHKQMHAEQYEKKTDSLY